MSYAVKEIYHSLQGEGYHTGRPAVLLRFAGCNLWTGRARDRDRAVCRFCDTDFVGTDGPGGGVFTTADALADAVVDTQPAWDDGPPFVVCTGGEPLLQLDRPLIDALHARHATIAVETNGTLHAPEGIDWICVSPKAHAPLLLDRGDELKFVYPQRDAAPEQFVSLSFDHFYLQPMDGPDRVANTERALAYMERHPRWKLSIQTHKVFGLP
ncbi:MAG TPA: 7-carboxy-7-deazaguanine synthase [Gemmatimonadales bacterium]|jgi:7-carboxy-7-deazaguanine synthase (Cx14CxxC type)